MKTAHLNNEQFTAYLLDTDSNPATAAHLVACVICREELELFRQSVSSFNSLTLAWSESRAAAQVRRAVPRLGPGFRAWFGLSPLVLCWLSALRSIEHSSQRTFHLFTSNERESARREL